MLVTLHGHRYYDTFAVVCMFVVGVCVLGRGSCSGVFAECSTMVRVVLSWC